ncbi:MAG: DUF2064 domain-containing protein [Candidatus Sumerlaeaceae bacterium]|nr:DUF2064 domain-containing protein [Candidatus Sumerlaeaceae bacterium]
MDTLVPEIEKALIVFVTLPAVLAGSAGDSAAQDYQRTVESQLTEIAACDGVTPYVFFDPPEADEEIAEWLGAFEDRFAFAAHVDEEPAAQIKAAFRRIFNRNATQKVVVITSPSSRLNRQAIADAFAALDATDLVIAPSTGNSCSLIGISKWHPWLFEAGVLDSVESTHQAAVTANATVTRLS